MPVIEIFCDGGCANGRGSWGAVLRFGTRKKEFSGAIKGKTTSQRAEMIAFLEAFNVIKDRRYEIHVFTDSHYLQKGVSLWSRKWRKNGWKTAGGAPVKNADLWKQILLVTDGCNIHWHWVRGHAGHPENERADRLAANVIGRSS